MVVQAMKRGYITYNIHIIYDMYLSKSKYVYVYTVYQICIYIYTCIYLNAMG